MKVYHVTRKANKASILKRGIDPVHSTGRQMLSWFVSFDKMQWAILHVMRRHFVHLEDVIVFQVEVPDGWVRKTGRYGVFNTKNITGISFTDRVLSVSEACSLRDEEAS